MLMICDDESVILSPPRCTPADPGLGVEVDARGFGAAARRSGV
jgi:hypothetical protein